MRYLLFITIFFNFQTYAQSAHSVPTLLENLLNKPLANHGPNCWGTAMYLKGVSQSPRFVSSAEIQYWQESPLCRPLERGEEILPGDILNVYGPEYAFKDDLKIDETQKFINLLEPGKYLPAFKEGYTGFHRLLHSETFINKYELIGKESPNKLDRFKITKLTSVYGRPRHDVDCQESPIQAPHLRQFNMEPRNIRESKCAYFTKVFRCQEINEKVVLSTSERLVIDQANRYQDRIFEAVKSKDAGIHFKEKLEMKNFANKEIVKLKKDMFRPLTKNEKMSLSLRFFSLNGVLKGLSWLDEK